MVCELVGECVHGVEGVGVGGVVLLELVGFAAEGLHNAAGVVSAAHGHAAGAADLKNLVGGFAEDLDEAFDLAGAAGHLEHDGLGCEVDDASAEDLRELEDLRARVSTMGGLRADGDLDEAELADDGLGAVDLIDLAGDFELIERGADAVRGVFRRVADDGHAGHVLALGFANGEGGDVEVKPAEERGDAGEDAGFVVD